MISSLMTWYNYNQNCVSAFYDSQISVLENRTIVLQGEGDFTLDFDWEAGWGYLFVVVATLLKIVDVICNLAVPTPEICRDHAEQQMYEIVAINRDVNDGDGSHYTGDSIRRLRASVMLAKEECLRFSVLNGQGLSGMNDSGLCAMDESKLSAIEESGQFEEEDVVAPLPTAKSQPAPTTTTLEVPHAATPTARNRLHKSVYF